MVPRSNKCKVRCFYHAACFIQLCMKVIVYWLHWTWQQSWGLILSGNYNSLVVKRYNEKQHYEKRHNEKRHYEKRHNEKRHYEKRDLYFFAHFLNSIVNLYTMSFYTRGTHDTLFIVISLVTPCKPIRFHPTLPECVRNMMVPYS